MKIITDNEGYTVVKKLVDVAVKSGAFQDSESVIAILKSIEKDKSCQTDELNAKLTKNDSTK